MGNSGYYMTTGQAAKELGISRIAVWLRWKRGKLKAEKGARRLFIPVEEIEAIRGKVRQRRPPKS